MKKKFCKKGHDIVAVGRYKSDGGCKKCHYISDTAWRDSHREQDRVFSRKWQQNNPEKVRSYQCKWRSKNLEKVRRDQRTWYKQHPKQDYISQVTRQLKRKHRVPSFGQDGITEFYFNCPKGYEVDHIIPLCGKKVSGLHVIWNLQYLTKEANRKKSNRLLERKV